MKKSWIILAAIGLLVIILFMWVKNGYNQMVTYNESVSKAWSDVENQYQRRMDLIPNLVNTVKGYADFEKSTLTAVIEARAKATQVTIDPSKLNAQSMQQFQQAQGELSGALSRLMVTVERYPDLKANQSFLDLQSQLEGTENRIAVERRNFNDAARIYNTYIKRFPNLFFARSFGFEEKAYFEADKTAAQPPKVQF
ncbi:MAG TPA: LemA family protein [Williamwhitmania sp.]|jgi:LemA protein|nr:LemA family protein [Williamwhitmania sp.]